MENLPKLQPLPLLDTSKDDYVQQKWQELVNSVEPESIPLDMLKSVTVTLTEGEKLSFPIKQWTTEGISIETIEVYMNTWMDENEYQIESTNFILDLEELKEVVTKESNKALKNL